MRAEKQFNWMLKYNNIKVELEKGVYETEDQTSLAQNKIKFVILRKWQRTFEFQHRDVIDQLLKKDPASWSVLGSMSNTYETDRKLGGSSHVFNCVSHRSKSTVFGFSIYGFI
jgi:hypothetical protein